LRMHRTHFASAKRDQPQVEPTTPNNGGKAGCSYRGLWALLTDCQDAAPAPAKPAAAPSGN